MERRDNLVKKFRTDQTQEASFLEGILNEKNEIDTLRDKLGLRLKKTHIKIKVLRRQIEFYKVAHSKLKNIFLSGLEVFKQVDFRSNVSVESNKFSLEVLQKHFLEYADKVGSLCEIPTERQLESYICQKSTKFQEDLKTRRGRSIIVSRSDSEDGGPDDTNLEFGTAWNRSKLDGGTDEELLRDSGLESVKEEIGANDIDLSDIQFDEGFSVSTEFAAGETNKGRSEVVKCRNVTVTQNIGNSSSTAISLERVTPEVVMLDENQPLAKGENRKWRNVSENLHENCQRNEPARGIYNTTILHETPRRETPIPVGFNLSRDVYDSSILEKGLLNSSREKQYEGEMTRGETYTSEPRGCNTPMTATTDDMASTMMNGRSRSPVFKDCNPRKHSGRQIEDFSRNCSTPFRQLNENFGRTLVSLRGYSRKSARKKMFSRRSKYTKSREEEDDPSGTRKLGLTFMNIERFKSNNPEQGVRLEDRENKSFARDRLSDCSRYDNTSEDDNDDIIYGSPGKVNQLYLNPRRQKVRREVVEEPSCQSIPQTSAVPDLDETFISPTVVKNYQMSRGMGPPLQLPPGHHRTTCEVSPEYDSVPFAYQRGPVRKRAERMKLPGQACAECDKYYNNVYGDANTDDYNRMLNKCSRHRNAGGQEDTPPGYWTPFLTGS